MCLLFHSVADVCDLLTLEGFQKAEQDIELQGHQFYVDRHCPDVISFPSDLRAFFEEHSLVQSGHLVIQVRNLLDILQMKTYRPLTQNYPKLPRKIYWTGNTLDDSD